MLRLLHLIFGVFVLLFLHPPRSTFGKSCVAATTRGLGSTPSPTAVLQWRPTALGYAAPPMAGMARGLDSGPTGDRCALASCRFQVVLEMDFALQIPPGRRVTSKQIRELIFRMVVEKSDLGSTANSWRTKDARLQDLRAYCFALDAQSAQESPTGHAMGCISAQPPRSDRCNGLLHCANADLWHALLLLRHRP